MNSQTDGKIIKRMGLSTPFYLGLSLCLFISTGLAPETARGMDRQEGVYLYGEKTVQPGTDERLDNRVRAILENYHRQDTYRVSTVTYPYDESIFPPEIAAPTFKWVEKEEDISNWLVTVNFENGHNPLFIVCDKPHWTPDRKIWELMKQHSVQGPAQITILGVNNAPTIEVVSKGIVKISTSRDAVGAPIMFRRVPPSFAYAAKHPELMEWALADISSYEESPVIMSKQPMCGSCHTFSRDGSVFGMDMDYKKDKGAYFFTRVRADIVLTDQDFISWNDFSRTDGLQSTGLYSRISPDGKHIASTVNEIFFLIKIPDPYFSQLFFPLQGSLAVYSNNNKKVSGLPGADLRDFVQTDPAWSPDGNHLLFSRAPANMDLFWDLGGQTIFSVEHADIDRLNKQYPVKFDIYRIPFNGGKGGLAEPLPGASNNGKSNYNPRYSPDGKWIVFTQSETGLAIQQDSKLFIMPAAGGDPRMMNCNLSRVNSWHTWSPNSRWLAFVSKENTPYTELFLTHIDDKGNDSPPVLLSRFNKQGYAINVPEFANIPSGSIRKITLKRY
ncbi:hypothetical protein N9174_02990 [bacterium]|nr:hypothetical protein [bacterium]